MSDKPVEIADLIKDIAAREREIEKLQRDGHEWLKKAQESGDPKAKADLEKIVRDVEARIIDLRSALAGQRRSLQRMASSAQGSN